MPVRGSRQVSSNLRNLASYVVTPANAASRFALRPTLTQSKQNLLALPLKEETGTLAKSLKIIKKARQSKFKPVHQVGPDSQVEAETQYGRRRPVRYAHLIEFGTAPHQQGDGLHPGTPPRPFMTPAFFETRGEVVKRFGSQIGKEMEKRAAKLRKR